MDAALDREEELIATKGSVEISKMDENDSTFDYSPLI
jgi:hypothetical protein